MHQSRVLTFWHPMSQWPTVASASSCAAVCWASISSDRSSWALAPPGLWIWEAMPCWKIFQLARCKNLNWKITTTPPATAKSQAITAIKPDICQSYLFLLGYVAWWWMVATAGFCWQVTWSSWAADKGSNSGMSLAICGIPSVKSKAHCTQCCQRPMKTHTGGYGSGQVRIVHSLALAQPQDMVKIVLQ